MKTGLNLILKQNRILGSVLAVVAALESPAYAGIQLLQTARFEIPETATGSFQLATNLKGEELYISIEDQSLASNSQDVVTRRVSDGKELGRVSLPKRARHFSHVEKVLFPRPNFTVVAVRTVPIHGNQNGHESLHLISVELNSAQLVVDSPTESISTLQDAIKDPSLFGLPVVLVHSYRDNPNATPRSHHVYRVIDLVNGLTEAELVLKEGGDASLAFNQDGALTVLIAGYERIALWHPRDGGQVIDIVAPRTQPSVYPSEIKLASGEVLLAVEDRANHPDEVLLVSKRDLFKGKISPIRKMAKDRAGISTVNGRQLIITHGNDEVEIRDLETDLLITRLDRLERFRDAEPVHMRGLLSIENLVTRHVRGKDHTVLLVHGFINPNSFLPGSILTVYDATEDKILAQVRSSGSGIMHESLSGHVTLGSRGELLLTYWAQHRDTGIRVLNADSGQVLIDANQLKGLEAASAPVTTKSGKTVLLLVDRKNKRVVVQNLLNLKDQTQVVDPLIHPGVIYGYDPKSLTPGELTLPLLSSGPGSSLVERGLLRLEIL